MFYSASFFCALALTYMRKCPFFLELELFGHYARFKNIVDIAAAANAYEPELEKVGTELQPKVEQEKTQDRYS